MQGGLKKVRQKILEARSVAISGHINSDGDSIGSMLSLGLGLEKLGKQVFMISCYKIPDVYKLLPGASRFLKKRRIF